MRRVYAWLILLGAAAVAGGCAGSQSALQPSGSEAAEIRELFLLVTAISAAITLLVLVLIFASIWGSDKLRGRIGRTWIVFVGGIIFPVIVLSGLLAYGLVIMNAGASRAARADGPEITVIGKQWWWKVEYITDQGQKVISANELRVPVRRPVRLRLESEDVIHSFWAPRLAGKLDMIPGRTNQLTIEVTDEGISRGQCAEYCGGAHALMSFYVIAMPPEQYEAWLVEEAAPAAAPDTQMGRLGQKIFLENGCGGCHAIRGTDAAGTIGPDLTHVGSRRSLAAATLTNNAEMIALWISENQHIKPDNHMPAYRNFEPEELEAIATYLGGLK